MFQFRNGNVEEEAEKYSQMIQYVSFQFRSGNVEAGEQKPEEIVEDSFNSMMVMYKFSNLKIVNLYMLLLITVSIP